MGSTKVQAPPPRDYYKEMQDTIRAQIDMAPQMIAAERSLIPQWQQLQKEQMLSQSQNLRSFYREVMGDSANLMSEYGSLFADRMIPIAEKARITYDAGLGGGAELQEAMRRSAISDLNAGMGLTPEMEREAMNRARAAMTLRGLAGGGQGVAAEVLSGYNMGLARQDRARLFAQSVLGNDVNMSNAAFTQYGSPLISSGMNALSPMGLAGMSVQYNQNLGPAYLQPESQYASNLNAANQNMQLQAAVANAQNSNAIKSAWIGVAGKVLSNVTKQPSFFGGGGD